MKWLEKLDYVDIFAITICMYKIPTTYAHNNNNNTRYINLSKLKSLT